MNSSRFGNFKIRHKTTLNNLDEGGPTLVGHRTKYANWGLSMLKVVEKVGVTLLLRASRKGGAGLYLYVPGDYADTYNMKSGDKIEARIVRILREVPDVKPVDSSVKDLSEVGKRAPRRNRRPKVDGKPTR